MNPPVNMAWNSEKARFSGHTTWFFDAAKRDNTPQCGKNHAVSDFIFIFQCFMQRVLRLDRVAPQPYGLAAFVWLRANGNGGAL
jgi:hypothetical protein